MIKSRTNKDGGGSAKCSSFDGHSRGSCQRFGQHIALRCLVYARRLNSPNKAIDQIGFNELRNLDRRLPELVERSPGDPVGEYGFPDELGLGVKLSYPEYSPGDLQDES